MLKNKNMVSYFKDIHAQVVKISKNENEKQLVLTMIKALNINCVARKSLKNFEG